MGENWKKRKILETRFAPKVLHHEVAPSKTTTQGMHPKRVQSSHPHHVSLKVQHAVKSVSQKSSQHVSYWNHEMATVN